MDQNDKKTFRKQMLAKRDVIPYEKRITADATRTELIRNWEVYKNADYLLFFVSYRSEADTIKLIKEALEKGRFVAVPKVSGQEMVFCRITDFSELTEGYKGILEPDTDGKTAITAEEFATWDVGKVLLFMPGCAFDKKGGRMGYGGGFYDRFTKQYPSFLRVALAYEEQWVETVPQEVHDMPVDVIVTEAGICKPQDNNKTEDRVMENEYSKRGVRAMELFQEGYNCAQAVVLAYEDFFEESPETLAAMISSFGGGMGRLREVCGAVSGMFFVAGKLYGYSDPKASKEKMDHYARIQELAASFRERNGSIVCRELLGLQEKVSVPVPEERTAEYYKKRPCKELVADAASILEYYMEKYPVEK